MHWCPTGLNIMGAHINIILGWGRKTVGASQCLKINFCIFPDREMELGYLVDRFEYLVMTSSV